MLPEGFEDLVKRVLKEDASASRRLPSSRDDLWKNFVWGVFLDQNRLEAEANYIYDIVDSAGLFEPETVKKLGLRWGDKLCEVCRKEMKHVRGRKSGILQAVTTDESVERATRCVLEAVAYFKDVTPRAIRNRARSEKDTNDLMTEIAYPRSDKHVYNIGLTKTILWLQSFGLGNHLCPPSRQAMNFVEQDLGHRLGRDFEDEMGVWGYYFPFLGRIKEVARIVEKSLKTPVTERDVGKAIWYYKSCQSLVATFNQGLKRLLTPQVLLDFADSKKWALVDLAEKITDIDEVDSLREDLRRFI